MKRSWCLQFMNVSFNIIKRMCTIIYIKNWAVQFLQGQDFTFDRIKMVMNINTFSDWISHLFDGVQLLINLNERVLTSANIEVILEQSIQIMLE